MTQEEFKEKIDKQNINNLSLDKQRDLLEKYNINFDVLNKTIYFGKHKGTRLIDIPVNYMVWLLKANILKSEDEINNLLAFLKHFKYNIGVDYILCDDA
jgi:uncharacterized protein (DUF3820 family)